MHNPALVASGIDAQYVRVQVPVGSVAEAFRRFRDAGFVGINVTIPHKFEALKAVDELDPLAEKLGAVNTVAIRDGRLYGYNTDGPGFLRSLKEAFHVEVKDLRVLILGAGGGAGKAVLQQSVLAGCRHLTLVNRSMAKMQNIAAELGPQAPELKLSLLMGEDWNEPMIRSALKETDLIVNATSLGMKVDDAPVVPEGAIRSCHLVYDMVYRASGETPLISQAREVGAKHADGMSLLLHQGAVSFEHWFNRPAPLEVMRAGLKAAV
jgi:shikimate dehydrogenase